MKSPIIVIGIGEVGSVLARGFLKNDYPIYPVTRETDMNQLALDVVSPEAVIVAVGESDLQDTLQAIPDVWRSKLILIQNELLPRDWEQHDLDPTVISVWFEKKKGQDVKVVVPSPIYGSKAEILSNALSSLEIPSEIIDDKEQMLFELVRKNFYILTSNIGGLKSKGTVTDLWENHNELAKSVVDDVHEIQHALVGIPLDKSKLTDAMLVAFSGDPEHGCMGRSAPARLARALDIAESHQLSVPTLKAIQNDMG